LIPRPARTAPQTSIPEIDEIQVAKKRNIMTLLQLQHFRVLAKVQHYTKASQLLFVSQPSLSHSIAELEKELSVRLFEKQGKKTSLSIYGEIFLKHVERSLDELKAGSDEINMLNPLAGKVNLGYIYSLSAPFLPGILDTFYSDESNKSITFNFRQELNSALLEALKDGSLDLAFCPNPDKIVSYVPISRQELYLIVPKDHPCAGKEEIDIREVGDNPFILINKKSGLRQTVEDAFNAVQIKPRISSEADECNAVITFVSLRFGVSIIPNVPALESSNVSALRIKNPEFCRTIYMAWAKKTNTPPYVKRVRDFIIAHYEIKTGKENGEKTTAKSKAPISIHD